MKLLRGLAGHLALEFRGAGEVSAGVGIGQLRLEASQISLDRGDRRLDQRDVGVLHLAFGCSGLTGVLGGALVGGGRLSLLRGELAPKNLDAVLRRNDLLLAGRLWSVGRRGAKNVELQGCLLAGYTPRTSYRVCGKSIPLFGAVAYAGKDGLITDTKGEQIGDLLDRSIILRFKAPDQAPPEMDEIAEEDADLLASALVAWTDSCRDQLRQAARDIATEDRDTERAGDLRSMQIWRPLRAICRVADGLTAEELAEGKRGPWETAIDEASWELTAGAAGVEAQDTLDELTRRAQAWGAGEPGEIVTEPGYDGEEW